VVTPAERGGFALELRFEGPPDAFIRRELVIPLQ
jgi:hypothetical protein